VAAERGAALSHADVVGALRAAGCVFAEEEAELLVEAAGTQQRLAEMVRDRSSGLPLEQVVGWAAFCGLRIVVRPGVFVPRRRTELMAAEAIDLARRVRGRRPVVVDLCCGAGAVGAAVSAAVDVELHAADLEAPAVECARENIGDRGLVVRGDLYDPLPERLRGRVDVLAANVPYVPTDEIDLLPAEARLHEPRVTLDGGADGLHVLRRVASGAPAWLVPGGSLLVETTEAQVEPATRAFEASGLAVRVARSEELQATVVVGVLSRRPREPPAPPRARRHGAATAR
jgi:release factor glutamine methyltransferase